MNNFSENLKKIRKENNLSQEQLASELGVSRQAISKWESGIAYPEMDKIIQLCKKFELNIDDLLNKNIKEIKDEEESKNNINKYIDDFLCFITDTVNLFSNMSFKTKIKCLFEQLTILIILVLLILIIGIIGNSIFQMLFYNLLPDNIYSKLFGVIASVYLIFASIVSIIILVHTFKIRYLDYYKNMKKSINIKEEEITENVIKIDNKNKIIFKENQNKIIIRDSKNNEYKFINGIIKLLILFVKFFALFTALFLCTMLIFFVACFIISFTIIKTGIFFIGLIISMVSLSIICSIVILLLLNFIFNRKNNKKKMIWSFLGSIILLGIGCGLFFVGSLQFDINNSVDKSLLETKSFQIDMDSNLVIINNEEIEYIEKDIDNIIIEYDINKKYDVEYEMWDDEGKKILSFYNYGINDFESVRTVLNEINSKKIINVNGDILNIKVYASKKNIEILKENKKLYK